VLGKTPSEIPSLIVCLRIRSWWHAHVSINTTPNNAPYCNLKASYKTIQGQTSIIAQNCSHEEEESFENANVNYPFKNEEASRQEDVTSPKLDKAFSHVIGFLKELAGRMAKSNLRSKMEHTFPFTSSGKRVYLNQSHGKMTP
jgi:hypothetical protein